MPAETNMARNRALKVDSHADLQLAQVRAAERLGRNAHLERVGCELGHGETGTVDGNAVAQVHVIENGSCIGDGEGGAAAAGGGCVERDE
jgi:hypothetical protein